MTIRSHLVRRAAAWVLSSLVIQASGLSGLAAVASAADNAPTVVVLPLTGNEAVPIKAPARFRELLVSELKGRDTLSVVDLPKSLAKAVDPESMPSRKPSPAALSALEEGQQKLSDLRFDDAATALKKGIDGMTAQPASIDFDKLIDAYISLSVAQFRQGDEDSAQKALLAVVRLSPDYRLPDGKFPPIFVREFQKAKRRTEKSAKGTISIDGPAGATAFIDGRDLGMVPAVQDNLTAGQHFVKVEGTRGELFGQLVEVKNGVSKVRAQFVGGSGDGSGPSLAAVGPTLGEAEQSTVASACQSLNANFAVVGTLYRSGEHQLTIASALFSAKRKAFTELKTFTFDEELLTANVEAYKLADDLGDGMEDFPRAVRLPLNLASAATYHVSKIERATAEVEVVPTGRRTALTHSDARPEEQPEQRAEQKPGLSPDLIPDDAQANVRRLNQRSVDADAQSALLSHDPDTGPGVKSAGPGWWVWALVGVGVVAAAGGTYYGISEATRPVTGTVTAKW